MVENDLAEKMAINMGAALSKGTFERFQLDSVSYYPVDKIASNVAQIIYGVDLRKEGLLDSKVYQQMEKDERIVINPNHPFAHTHVDGEVLLLREESGLVICLLDIKRIFDVKNLELNLGIISQRALPPNYHQVEGVSPLPKPDIYSIDQDGSKWSLHCK